MYWTDLDQDVPRVERARMDGTERMVLPGVNGTIKLPSSIAVDPLTSLVYWSDTFPDNEKIVRYDGERDTELGIPRMLLSLYLVTQTLDKGSFQARHNLICIHSNALVCYNETS